MKFGFPSKQFAALTLVLLLIAVSGYGLYFGQTGSSKTVTVKQVSYATIINGQNTTVTFPPSGFSSGSRVSTGIQTVTVTSTATIGNTGLYFNDTLIIIPNGIASNPNLNYVPSSLKIVIGRNNTVTWFNQDPESQHTVVTASGPSTVAPIAIILETNQTYTFRFTEPGTYHFYCMWHPWMQGTIVVLN